MSVCGPACWIICRKRITSRWDTYNRDIPHSHYIRLPTERAVGRRKYRCFRKKGEKRKKEMLSLLKSRFCIKGSETSCWGGKVWMIKVWIPLIEYWRELECENEVLGASHWSIFWFELRSLRLESSLVQYINVQYMYCIMKRWRYFGPISSLIYCTFTTRAVTML